MEKPQSLLPTLSVSECIATINQTLDYAYPGIEVEGEVASFTVNQGKYVFFDIKDPGGSLGCFMTVWQLRVPIENGMKVVIRATAKLTQWGKFSLTVQSIRPKGEGSLRKSYELLKEKLQKEGIFAPERKRRLPVMPGRVAVISSTGAAGYADFIKILDDRWGGVQVDVAHTQVQGADAPDQIIRAIRYFNEQAELADVLVIIRGGGSADDLSGFNDELLVREIAASRIPTVVGVGHETDETLADYAADVRAATPSNAAQLVVPNRSEIRASVAHSLQLAGSLLAGAIESTGAEIQTKLAGMVSTMADQWQQEQDQLVSAQGLLEAYSPMAVLARGYAIMRGTATVGETVDIETVKQRITAEVTHVSNR